MKKYILILSVVLLAAPFAFADEAPPPPKPMKAKLQIVIDDLAKETTMEISRETLENLLNGQQPTAAVSSNVSASQTIFGGLLLSASFVFGGVWLVRRNGSKGIVPAAGAVIAVVLGTGVLALGNAAPPIFQRIDSQLFSDGMKTHKYARGEIKIQVVDDRYVDGVKLIVAPEKKAKESPKN